MAQCSICYDDVIDHPAPEGMEATGSHRSSCGHLFHPKCISKWHVSQEESTCPMCRKKAGEMEDCSLRLAQEETAEPDLEEDDDVIHITRVGMDYIIRSHGGMGVIADVEARLDFDQFGEVTIARPELALIMAEQGATPLSDEQWTRLTTIYPSAEPEEDAEPADVRTRFGTVLTFAMWEPEDSPRALDGAGTTLLERAQEVLASSAVIAPEDTEAWAVAQEHARTIVERAGGGVHHYSNQHACPLERFSTGVIPASYTPEHGVWCDICDNTCATVPFYHCNACEFDICGPCYLDERVGAEMVNQNRSILGRANLDALEDDEDDMSRITRIVVDVEHQPGPFDFEYEGARFTLRRSDIQRLLQERGSLATMVEFFNEEGEDPGAETLVVTMTLESLNARFASLGANPVSFMDAQRAVEARPRVILNPEDD